MKKILLLGLTFILLGTLNVGAERESFTRLRDTPATYKDQAGKSVTVRSDESGLEFSTAAGSGDMTKAVYDANDDGKIDTGAIADISGTYLLIESINTLAELVNVSNLGAFSATLLAATDEANFKFITNLEIGTDVLAPNGSGASLTGIPLDSDFGSNGIMERTGAGTYDTASGVSTDTLYSGNTTFTPQGYTREEVRLTVDTASQDLQIAETNAADGDEVIVTNSGVTPFTMTHDATVQTIGAGKIYFDQGTSYLFRYVTDRYILINSSPVAYLDEFTAELVVDVTADRKSDASHESYETIKNRAAGETIVKYQVVCLNQTDAEWHVVRSGTTTDNTGPYGIALEAGTDGVAMEVSTYILIRNDNWAFTGAGYPVYISSGVTDVDNGVTELVPTTSGEWGTKIGEAQSDDEVLFDFRGHHQVIVE